MTQSDIGAARSASPSSNPSASRLSGVAFWPRAVTSACDYRESKAGRRSVRASTVGRRIARSLAALGAIALAGCATLPTTAGSSADIAALGNANDWPALLAARASLSDPGWQAALKVQLAAARLDNNAARIIAEQSLSRKDLGAAQRTHILSSLAGVAFARGDYAYAAETADRWLVELAHTKTEKRVEAARQLSSTAQLLSAAPPQRIESAGHGAAALWRDKVGLVRARAHVGEMPIEAVLDTGANLSVIRRSLAERLGLRFVDGKAAVGSSTVANLDIRIAIADRLEFAGATLHHVAFIVLDDDALTFPVPGGYAIDAIIGFPVFLALKRFAFTPDTFSWGSSVAAGGRANLFANGSDLYLELLVDGKKAAFHLDTGAAHTELTGRFAERYPDYRSERLTERSVSGAGGTSTDKVVKLEQLTVQIGDWKACVHDIDLALGEPTGVADDHLGRLGQDVIGQAGAFRIDLEAMKADAETASSVREFVCTGGGAT